MGGSSNDRGVGCPRVARPGASVPGLGSEVESGVRWDGAEVWAVNGMVMGGAVADLAEASLSYHRKDPIFVLRSIRLRAQSQSHAPLRFCQISFPFSCEFIARRSGQAVH